MIENILWDIDGTLLDFLAAEKYAVKACFEKFGLGVCTDEMVAEYSAINLKHWKMLERGEITKPQVLRGRYVEFFELENIKFDDVDALNREYQFRLGDKIFFNDNSYEIVKKLKNKVKQYAVTNGTFVAQERKLERSGLGELFDGVFISEKVGFEKPKREFFDKVFDTIGNDSKNATVIVGDSLTSDMQGGNNAGIACCWYNPQHVEAPKNLKIDYEIDNLNKIYDVIAKA